MHQKLKYKTQNNTSLRRKQRTKFHVIGFGNHFLEMIPKIWATKEKLDQLDCMKINNFVHQKTTHRVKRQFMQCEKLFVSHVADKELISQVYRALLNLTTKVLLQK
jgi:hypothetical protein